MNLAYMIGMFHNGKHKYAEFVESGGRYCIYWSSTSTIFSNYNTACNYLALANNATEEDIYGFDHDGKPFEIYVIDLKCYPITKLPDNINNEFVYQMLRND